MLLEPPGTVTLHIIDSVIHEPFIALIRLILFSFGIIDCVLRKAARELETMPRAHHRSKGPPLSSIVGLRYRKRPDPSPSGVSLRCPNRRFVVMRQRRNNGPFDPRAGQRLADPARSITPSRQGAATGLGKRGVIDIARLSAAPDETGNVRLASTCPAALADLSSKIGRKFATGRRITPDIVDRQAMERLLVERLGWAARGHAPRLCHSRA
jgi:hypothetical protein